MPAFRFGDPSGPHELFGITLASGSKPEMVQVHARRLPPPKITFTGNSEGFSTGSWSLKGKKFHQTLPASEVKITYIELLLDGATSCDNLTEFINGVNCGLQNHFSSNHRLNTMKGYVHTKIISRNVDPRTTGRMLVDTVKGLISQNIQLLFVILPDKSTDNYYFVKRAADCIVGIHTVCTTRDRFGKVKTKPEEIANLCLKVNQKLGGINHTVIPSQLYSNILGETKSNAMFIGADVTHPGPSAMVGAPSIAAVVATYDQNFFHYPGSLRLQRHIDENKKAIETIQQLDVMVDERLKLYRSKNKWLPGRIIFVSDGVSDGQFAQVLVEEVPRLQRARKRAYSATSSPLPKLLVLVIQKRHHTRFFKDPKDTSDAFDDRGNPLPGFTLDRNIVSPYHFDWYNTSHASIQGTSRPGKYIVLYDTIGVSADQIQMLMYHMCFKSGRATKSIGVHPAARYADMLCDRARLYARDVFNPLPTAVKPVYRVTDSHWASQSADRIKDSIFYV